LIGLSPVVAGLGSGLFKDGIIIEKRAHYNLADIMDQLTAGSAA
jgi:hypothetical protein